MYLPTIMSSVVPAFFLMILYKSSVNKADALLKIDVKSLINAAIITASIIPRKPWYKFRIRKSRKTFLFGSAIALPNLRKNSKPKNSNFEGESSGTIT